MLLYNKTLTYCPLLVNFVCKNSYICRNCNNFILSLYWWPTLYDAIIEVVGRYYLQLLAVDIEQ
jgi:hypothetical protein